MIENMTKKLGMDKKLYAAFTMIGLTFVCFYFWRSLFLRGYDSLPLGPIISLIFAFCFIKLTRDNVPVASRFILFITGPMYGLYALFLQPALLESDLSGPSQLVLYMTLVQGAAFFSALVGFFRPSFFVVSFTSVYWLRRAQGQAYDLGFGVTDYLTVLETSLFLLFGLCLLWGLMNANINQLPSKIKKVIHAFRQHIHVEQTQTLLIFFMIAIHFGNYFYAGFAKLILNGGVFSWVLENEIHFFAMLTSEYKRAGVSLLQPVLPYIISTFFFVVTLSNIVVLCGQFFSFMGLWNRLTVKLFSLFYDFFHIMIFMLSGIFFWKWVVLNTAIVLAIKHVNFQYIPRAAKILGILAVISSIHMFHIALLGWYNTRVMNIEKVYATFSDGAEYMVPTNYFLNASLPFAQHRMLGRPEGFFPVSGNGNTRDANIMRAAKSCDFDRVETSAQTPNKTWHEDAETMIRKHHAYVVHQINKTGRMFSHYDIYPHHIWSSPFEYNDFKKRDKRDIVEYKLSIVTYCLNRKGNHIEKRKINEATHRIPVE